MLDLSLCEAWSKLDSIYNETNNSGLSEAVRFSQAELNVSKDTIFKFLTTVADMNSSLRSRLLWSNVRTTGAQYDEYCDKLSKDTNKPWTFISLTAEPKKVALELRRPFGIEFDLNTILSAVKSKGFKYKAFNQLDVTANANSPVALRLNGVGKRKDGSCWFVLQGNYEPRDIDEKTYNYLLDWLKKNAKDQLVHFINDGRDPLELNTNFATGNKLRPDAMKYVYTVDDFIDYSDSTVTVKSDIINKWGFRYTELSNPCFIPSKQAGLGFTTIFRDEMSEVWATCLNKNIGLNSDFKYDQHVYNSKIPPLLQQSTGKSFAVAEEAFKQIAIALDEYEYRIYLPASSVFKFEYAWIKTVRLPIAYEIKSSNRGTRTINLEMIFNDFLKAGSAATDNELIDICNNNFVLNELENRGIVQLYRLLKQYNLTISFFNYAVPDTSWATKLNKPRYKSADFEPFTKDLYKAGKDHTRYLLSKSALNTVFSARVGTKANAEDDNYSVIKLTDKDGSPSLIYKNFIIDGNIAPARLEVRGIILGKDESDNWYIQVVQKGSWFELPGGSFDTLPNSESGLLPIAANKLSTETGLAISAHDLKLLDTITYMYEEQTAYIKKLTKGTTLAYPYTVDWLFVNKQTPPIDTTVQQVNNDGLAKWLLLDYALTSHIFMTQYRNLIPIIKAAVSN